MNVPDTLIIGENRKSVMGVSREIMSRKFYKISLTKKNSLFSKKPLLRGHGDSKLELRRGGSKTRRQVNYSINVTGMVYMSLIWASDLLCP
jgi:hypothetical protein